MLHSDQIERQMRQKHRLQSTFQVRAKSELDNTTYDYISPSLPENLSTSQTPAKTPLLNVSLYSGLAINSAWPAIDSSWVNMGSAVS